MSLVCSQLNIRDDAKWLEKLTQVRDWLQLMRNKFLTLSINNWVEGLILRGFREITERFCRPLQLLKSLLKVLSDDGPILRIKIGPGFF